MFRFWNLCSGPILGTIGLVALGVLIYWWIVVWVFLYYKVYKSRKAKERWTREQLVDNIENAGKFIRER